MRGYAQLSRFAADGSYKPAIPEPSIIREHPDSKVLTRRIHHQNIFWKEISWRFISALVFSAFIIVTLYKFSTLGNLSLWQKRGFHVVIILLSSFVSLLLGSLLGFLGCMIRWPLLARQENNPLDVDMILGIHNPTGALRLIWHHTANGKWTFTTLAVTVFLFLNISARLSVAAFGLTFDLNEVPSIEYQIKVADWSTRDWFDLSKDSLTGAFDDNVVVEPTLSNYATFGLLTAPTNFDQKSPSSYNTTNLGGQGLDRKVEGNEITYSYFLKEYHDRETTLSKDKVIHSSARCVGRRLFDYNVYENGTIVGNIETRDGGSEYYIRFLYDLLHQFVDNEYEYLWAAPLDLAKLSDPSACAITYLYKQNNWANKTDGATYFECTTCLTSRNNERGIGADVLHGLPPGNTSYLANLLLALGPSEHYYQTDSPDSLLIRRYPSINRIEQFVNALEYEIPVDQPRADVPVYSELHSANIAARLPILAIMGAEMILPKVTRDGGPSERPFVDVILTVRWSSVIAVLLAIIVGQLLIIIIVILYCRKVLVRDNNSYLSLARLMKSAMEKVDGRSTDTGVELAEYLETKNVRMRYGTRNTDKAGVYEVDLWNDVKNSFPDGKYG
ncbi:hypothetical protein TWF481_002316 [Arthrobotrys musiformis]|uniref:Uncharacterized protein n=1 Tax=Arthrobotrys musiformis TaxID=47236 RepID=A0AAV9VST8_9PEZI